MSWHPEIRKITAAGHNYALIDRGEGDEAVVLIHGITTYSFIWRKILPFLSDQKRIIVFDLLGCGESDSPLDVSYSLLEHAKRLRKLLTELGVKRIHLVGHDVGGGIAQIFSVRHPEMMIDLSLLNTVAYNYWPVQPITAIRTPLLSRFCMATLGIGSLALIVKRGLYYKSRLDDELLDLFLEPMRSTAGRRAFLQFARDLDNRNLTDITEDLRILEIPVLVIRGEADAYLSEEISLRLKREIPGCRLLRIPTGGHFLQEDEPELVAAALNSYWNENVVVGSIA